MSSFLCEHCNANIIDTPNGYVTECKHYPLSKEQRKLAKIYYPYIDEDYP